MSIKKSQFINLIKAFNFKELFNELGWDHTTIAPIPVKINEEIFTLTAVAEKRGFVILHCSPDSKGKIPTKDIRKKIDTHISKLYFEHLIIYSDQKNTQQIWQLVIREQDKPLTLRETDYFSTQHPESLFQRLRGLFISIDQEDNITLADVRSTVREQFNTNAERVTKRFYTEFKTQHTAFLKFIKGIEDNVSKEWYASLMLNRLMFIYFIQKKGFLDNNPNYLRDKLREIQQRKGKDKFFSFYRNFLLVLFHKGLGSPERNEELLKELGKVPYLNGGLFDVHQLEKQFTNIEIEDKAFEKIFAFFDEYYWHLDNRVTASGRDINPDVIGYIFEKYINDRAAMGAYYTKEDITEYIAKNTIIPFLFDQVKKDCANAFKDDSSLWKLLRENPDKYIYDAVKHGVSLTPLSPLQEGNLKTPPAPLQVGSFQASQTSLLDGSFGEPPIQQNEENVNTQSKFTSLRGDLGVFDEESIKIFKNQYRPIPKWYELPYNKDLVMNARELRKAGNKAEIIFWLQVKNKQLLGFDFDRQKVVGNFIVDFYCKDLAVAVEIDGSSHNDKVEYDVERDHYLKSVGLIVIHYTAEDVLSNIEGVIFDLKLKLIEIAKLSGIILTPPTPLQEGSLEIHSTPLQEWNTEILPKHLQEESFTTPLTIIEENNWEIGGFNSKIPSLRGDLGVFEDTDLDNPNHPLWKNFPDEIKQGFRPDLKDKIVVADERPHLWEIRKEWNKPAPPEIALPTEIWREVIERHKRYFELRRRITNGEIKEINDFITYNLNIRQFAQDAVEQYEGSDFINAFYKAITKITVLDPTCGSGAFLFAALNILEPLYYACIERMKGFIELDDLQGGKKFTQFRKVIEEIKKHPSQQYFIYKSIILNNLYGVDIMNEAVEIAKLRLFLKLVAEVDEFEHLEPLPDIDFNIRAGNTLIGYTNKKEIEELEGMFVTDVMKKKIFDECDLVARAFKRFKEIQLENYSDKTEFNNAKQELNQRLNLLKIELDKILHKQHYEGVEYNHWLNTHKPFHWYAEFYEIMESGGFDVIIGNPPYISISKIEYLLKFSDYQCTDLYGYVINRCFNLLKVKARYGFIVMHNLAFSRNFIDVRNIIRKNSVNGWFSFFARIPAGLFSGDVRVRNCIFLIERDELSDNKRFFTTRIHRWFAETRELLFSKINFVEFSFLNVIPMFNNETLRLFFENENGKPLLNYLSRNSNYKLYFKQNAYNWISVSPEPPPCYDEKGKSIEQSQISEISLTNGEIIDFVILLLNGKLFFSRWLAFGDEFHLTREDILAVKINFEELDNADKLKLKKIAIEFFNNLLDTIQYKLNAGKKVGTFNTSKLWYLTDESDLIFLKYLCNNPLEVFDEIENHVYQTVLTYSNQEIER